MTNNEAISNLNHIYGIVSPDIQRSLDLALDALRIHPKGIWKHKVIGDKTCVMCNQCYLHFDCESNFCPNCGAEMEV